MSSKYDIRPENTLTAVYSLMKNVSDIRPVAGTTGLLKGHRDDRLHLPKNILYLKNIPELIAISKRERSIDFGAAATLHDILRLGQKNIPSVLYQAIKAAANPNIRALATIGGNIAPASIKSSCLLPLIALNAKVEVRTKTETKWYSMAGYYEEVTKKTLPQSSIILRIRVPLEENAISYYRRLGPIGHIADDTASFLFLVRTQKDTISDVKMLFGGNRIIRSPEFDNRLLIGRKIPIPRGEIEKIMEEVSSIFSSEVFISEFQKQCFFNLIENSIYQLS